MKLAHAFIKQVYWRVFLFINRIDPTGTMIRYEARGIGPAEESIKLELESSYKPVSTVKWKGCNGFVGYELNTSRSSCFDLFKEEYGRRGNFIIWKIWINDLDEQIKCWIGHNSSCY